MLSIIIVNWNGKHHLKECFDSLRVQTSKDFEIVMVDNGSKDGSVEFIRENYPEVRLIELDYNSGFSQGNNIGIKESKGEFIVLLNNDTKVVPEWVESLLDAFERYPDAGLCASKIVYYSNPELIDSAGDGFAVCGVAFKRGHLQEESKYNSEQFVFGACGAGMAFRKAVLDEIGLLDEDFFAIYEDVDISFRAQLRGYKCIFVPSAVINHKVNSTLGKMSNFYVYNGQRNAEYVYFKNMPKKLIWRTFHIHLFYNLLGLMYFTIKGRGWSFLKAKIYFLKDIPKIKEKRRLIQQNIKTETEYIYGLMEKKWLSSRMRGKM